MNKHELYVEIMKLAPYEEATEDYRGSLSDALQTWEEMGRPQMSCCWCSRLVNREQFEVLGLRLPPEEVFCGDVHRYMVLFPLIISCMIPMKGKSSDVFKPEYLIPQLILEWVIKNKKFGILNMLFTFYKLCFRWVIL